MELVMQKRRQEYEGYILEPTGATYGQAIRTHDISIPSYREEMRRRGLVQLTGDNGNTSVRGLETTPPSLELCEMVVDVMAARREAAIEEIKATIREEELEMKDTTIGRDERAYLRLRVRGMKKVIELIESEVEITADDLYQFFRGEDIRLRGSFVPPELRHSLAVLRDEQEYARV